MPLAALAGVMRFAGAAGGSAGGLMAKAMADAVVPLVNESVSTPLLPAISRVTELTIVEDRNWRSAVRALVITLTFTGMFGDVPKLACEICSASMALAATPLVM